MRTQLLTDEMLVHFSEVDRLAQRHQEALEYSAASERMDFLHNRLRTLYRALVELRLSAELLHLLDSRLGDEGIWRQTCTDLRRQAPTNILSPGRAIVSGDVDLLQLVDYTGSAIALVSERRDRLIGAAAAHIAARQQAPGILGSQSESDPSAIQIAHQTIAQVADSGGVRGLASLVQELGLIDEQTVEQGREAELNSRWHSSSSKLAC